MLDNLSHFEFLTVAGALVMGGSSFSLTSTSLAQIYALEADKAEFKDDVYNCSRISKR